MEEFPLKNTNSSEKKQFPVFYLVIALLTVSIIILGCLPYILSRRAEKITPGESTVEYPLNGDGVDKYGRPAVNGKEMRGAGCPALRHRFQMPESDSLTAAYKPEM